MYDGLDLRVIERRHDADPRYREQLRQRVAAILDGSEAQSAEATAPELIRAMAVDVRPLARRSRDRRRSAWLVRGAAAALIAVTVGGLIVLTNDRKPLPPVTVPEPVPEPEPTTSPTEPPTTTPHTPESFVELAPGAMVRLPDFPLASRLPSQVWTGTELIVWGGASGGAGGSFAFDDGAAFDLAKGTWRVIAPAPISGRDSPAMVWTGTEVIVWGGWIADGAPARDGAAYNPATDTWRLLPLAPDGMDQSGMDQRMVWTGNGAVVVGCDGSPAAAYDPTADTWRALSIPSVAGCSTSELLWTGESIVVAQGNRMMRADLTAETWTVIDIGSSAAIVGVPGSDGFVSTFVNLPPEIGAPAQLLDSDGNAIAELPAFPGDPSVFGDHVEASGLWVGDEAVFWISAGEGINGWPEQVWALNPTTRMWSHLDADTAFPVHAHDHVVVAGDVLLMWGTPGAGDGARGVPWSSSSVAYRVGTITSG